MGNRGSVDPQLHIDRVFRWDCAFGRFFICRSINLAHFISSCYGHPLCTGISCLNPAKVCQILCVYVHLIRHNNDISAHRDQLLWFIIQPHFHRVFIYNKFTTIHIAKAILCNQPCGVCRRSIFPSFSSGRKNRVIIGGHILHIKEFTIIYPQIMVVSLENIHHLAAAILGIQRRIFHFDPSSQNRNRLP